MFDCPVPSRGAKSLFQSRKRRFNPRLHELVKLRGLTNLVGFTVGGDMGPRVVDLVARMATGLEIIGVRAGRGAERQT